MTRDELIKIIRETRIEIIHHELSGSFGEPSIEYDGACQTANRIIEELGKEKQGEVVLGDGEVSEDFMLYASNEAQDIYGKKGKLIFRE